MKKTTLLNTELSTLIARLGHMDTICIGDCGLPVPQNVERIDLALVRGVPTFKEVLEAIMSELCVEEITIATEMRSANPEMFKYVHDRFEGIKMNEGSHVEFKEKSARCVAVIRTGEASPYANIILQSGVKF